MNMSGMIKQISFSEIASRLYTQITALLSPERAADRRISTEADRVEVLSPRTTRRFAQALHENSNLELDWLWYAANMTVETERCYCLQRALEINPDSTLARRALAKLPQHVRGWGVETGELQMADSGALWAFVDNSSLITRHSSL